MKSVVEALIDDHCGNLRGTLCKTFCIRICKKRCCDWVRNVRRMKTCAYVEGPAAAVSYRLDCVVSHIALVDQSGGRVIFSGGVR